MIQSLPSFLAQSSIDSSVLPHLGAYGTSDAVLDNQELAKAQELSIPCHQAMTDGEVEAVVTALNHFA